MSDKERLRDLTNVLVNFNAGPSQRVDITDPHWKEKLLTEGMPHLYQQFGAMFPVIQELCGLYARASAEEQATVRRMVALHRDALNALNQFSPSPAKGEHLTYAEWKAGYENYKAQDFDGWLRMLIAALAIKLTKLDYRDDIMSINHLAHEAQQRGVDFEPYRQELIRLSDYQSAEMVGLRKKDV
jgi:hypothetical protein